MKGTLLELRDLVAPDAPWLADEAILYRAIIEIKLNRKFKQAVTELLGEANYERSKSRH